MWTYSIRWWVAHPLRRTWFEQTKTSSQRQGCRIVASIVEESPLQARKCLSPSWLDWDLLGPQRVMQPLREANTQWSLVTSLLLWEVPATGWELGRFPCQEQPGMRRLWRLPKASVLCPSRKPANHTVGNHKIRNMQTRPSHSIVPRTDIKSPQGILEPFICMSAAL